MYNALREATLYFEHAHERVVLAAETTETTTFSNAQEALCNALQISSLPIECFANLSRKAVKCKFARSGY
jgi:hypothetical protein